MSDRSAGDVAQSRLFVLGAIVLSMVLALIGRLWFLQVANGQQFAASAVKNATRPVTTTATRGLILDDRGAPFIDNETALVVTVDRVALNRLKATDEDAVLQRLSTIVHTEADTIKKEIQLCLYKSVVVNGKKTSTITNQPCWTGSTLQPVPVASFDTQTLSAGDLSQVTRNVLYIQENPTLFPGIAVSPQAVRTYPQTGVVPNTTLAAHLLGYTTPITGDDIKKEPALKAGADAGDQIGRGGLEQQYDAALRGVDGTKTIAVNAAGDPIKTLSDTQPTAGQDLVLNIDAPIQKAAEKALQTALSSYGPQYGAHPTEASAVVMKTTGEVVAIANTPSYDPSVFIGGISKKAYDKLSDPKGSLPLVDRAVDGEYAPGSTWKPFITAGLLQSGTASQGATQTCPGGYHIGTQKLANFEGESEPPLTLFGALTVSCDTVFYQWAYDLWLKDGGLRADAEHKAFPDKEILSKAAKDFGFGSNTGIDLPSGSAGAIVDRATRLKIWEANKADYCKGAQTRPKGSYLQQLDAENCTDGYTYRAGDAAYFAIGQGTNILVTPLQLARGYAAIANGGTLYEPTIGKALVTPQGQVVKNITPKVERKVKTSATDLQYIRDALYSVTHASNGTASGIFGDSVYPIKVSGKTGTAEVQHVDKDGNKLPDTTTSWFASFAPSDHPEYVVVVDVPNSDQGARVAAPAVRDIYDAIFGVRNGQIDPAYAHGTKLPTQLPCFQTSTGKVGPATRTCSASNPMPSPSPSAPAASASASPATADAAGVILGHVTDGLTPDRRRIVQ